MTNSINIDTAIVMKVPRKVHFIGSSRKDLRAFPEAAKDDLGAQLWDVQNDIEPSNWKPMPSIGAA